MVDLSLSLLNLNLGTTSVKGHSLALTSKSLELLSHSKSSSSSHVALYHVLMSEFMLV